MKLYKIENICIGESIEFSTTCGDFCSTSCDPYFVKVIGNKNITRTNTVNNYASRDGGSSTCKTRSVKEYDIEIGVYNDDVCNLGMMRNKLEAVMNNYNDSNDCCCIKLYYVDLCGETYHEFAKIGNLGFDNFQSANVLNTYTYNIESCSGGFISDEEITVKGIVGKLCNTPDMCSVIRGTRFIKYTGTMDGDYIVTIQAENLVNPTFWNVTKGSYYGLNGTFNGEIVIDTKGAVTYNGNIQLGSAVLTRSSKRKIILTHGINEIGLTAQSGSGCWELTYGNNRI